MANLVEHLEGRIPLRIQMQNPFKYYKGHNVLASAPLSFGERLERLTELPGLRVEERFEQPQSTAQADNTVPPRHASKYTYSSFPIQGTDFLQDDIIIYHRDWFRISNFHNKFVQRAKYMIGRYMNEVSGVHARVVQQCNELDEVWVPSKHHVEVFAAAGVEKRKLVVIPESIDPWVFDPGSVDPMMLPG